MTLLRKFRACEVINRGLRRGISMNRDQPDYEKFLDEFYSKEKQFVSEDSMHFLYDVSESSCASFSSHARICLVNASLLSEINLKLQM